MIASRMLGGLTISLLFATSGHLLGQVPSSSPSEAYQAHFKLATDAAQGVAKNLLALCNLPLANPAAGTSAAARAAPPPLTATRVFDNLYFVGLGGVSSWAITTSQGIILIDALNNAREAEGTVVAGLRRFGLDPAQIKYVIVTHAHGDHYGGAQYLVDRFHPRAIASEADWRGMTPPLLINNPRWDAPPKRDLTMADGEILVLGDTTLTIYVTPGHTPGTISLLVPVKDNGRTHVAALLGGTGLDIGNQPIPGVNLQQYASSAERFREVARTARVDVVLSNHPIFDSTHANLDALKTRAQNQPHPYVVGRDAVQRFFTVAAECAKARLAAL